ncbi:flagellar biosynthetic protein FliR [Butyrivibrio sp. MC2013]|uniref:flagellar biosynthetic protein FliR n=1 Tax=Butyrivibrio sp. MC2013 TaxID=1280686 RepID=UPI00047D7E34|nr:flagellar biosynthetic protein FliR [Butyrivibrio sp. MC2013]
MLDISFSYGDLEYFLLVVMRVSAFVFVAPFFSARGIPNMVKVAISLFTASAIFMTIRPDPVYYNSVFGYLVMVIKELMTGFIIAFSALLCMQIGAFAGQIVDMMTGLSMVSVMDPGSSQQVTISGVLYQQFLMVTLIISGMYRFLLDALADSFVLIPVSGMVPHSHLMLGTIVEFMKDYMVIGFRITLPVFIVTFSVNMILGILAKVSPQLNMFAVGIQIKILVGLFILFTTSFMLSGVSEFVFDRMRELMTQFASSISP